MAKKPTTAPPAAAASATSTATAAGTLPSAITDLGHARALPECSGWAHEYADPVHQERTIVQFYDRSEGMRLMRIVECDGVLSKAPVKPADQPEEP